MRHLIITLLIFSSLCSFGQMTFSALKHHFGDLQSYDNRFVDITITNKGIKDGYILSVRKPSEVVYIQNRAFIQKDSSLTLRFQVNPRQKGKFSYSVEIFTSDKADAHKLVLSGNLLEMEQNSNSYLTACPDFNSHPIGKNPNQFDLTVVTIDKTTRQELEQSKVSMIQDGFALWTEKTDKNGKIKKSGIVGLAYFYATHAGYFPAEKGAFVSNERNKVLIELERDSTKTPVIVSEPEPVVETSTTNEVVIEIEETTPQKEVVETSTTVPHSLEEISEENFDSALFEPVNVVFVMDVSSSMNQANKMELMKYSINQLSEMIRQEDRISLVTYASQAKVLLPPTSGMDKEAVKEQVKLLKAGGMTAGGEGIRLGLEQAKNGFIKDGLNHVFIITDGAFNQKQYNYKKLFKKYTKMGISLSVVGILDDAIARVSMKEIAQLGKGEYISVRVLLDAQKNIRKAVRKMAFKNKN
ncbi:MAG: VWA domain-containing protein [Crocinitomicaceae bacterium]|nr:VWA domain-containing protein [Crocinitomicaceae bacterium]